MLQQTHSWLIYKIYGKFILLTGKYIGWIWKAILIQSELHTNKLIMAVGG